MRITNFPALAAAALLIGSMAACDGGGERDPGPSDDEFGQIFFWRVVGSEVDFGDECTDDEGFRDEIEPIEFEKNSFLVYKVDDDGKTATDQDCSRVDGSTCDDSDLDIEYDIDDHTLTYDQEAQRDTLTSWACDLEVDGFWTLTDKGETMDFVVDLSVLLVDQEGANDTNNCEAAEADIKAQSENGKGFDGCVITHTIDLEFETTEDP